MEIHECVFSKALSLFCSYVISVLILKPGKKKVEDGKYQHMKKKNCHLPADKTMHCNLQGFTEWYIWSNIYTSGIL